MFVLHSEVIVLHAGVIAVVRAGTGTAVLVTEFTYLGELKSALPREKETGQRDWGHIYLPTQSTANPSGCIKYFRPRSTSRMGLLLPDSKLGM